MSKVGKTSNNPWIEHVKKYAKDKGLTYACAISEAKKTYKAAPKLKDRRYGKNEFEIVAHKRVKQRVKVNKLAAKIKDYVNTYKDKEKAKASKRGRDMIARYEREREKFNELQKQFLKLDKERYEARELISDSEESYYSANE